MQAISQDNIVDGKRKRVMSEAGVLACITSQTLSMQTSGKSKKGSVQKKKEQIEKESDSDQVQEIKVIKKKQDKVKITKSDLRELICSHFLIIDDEEQKQQQPKKFLKIDESESEEESESEQIPQRKRLVRIK